MSRSRSPRPKRPTTCPSAFGVMASDCGLIYLENDDESPRKVGIICYDPIYVEAEAVMDALKPVIYVILERYLQAHS